MVSSRVLSGESPIPLILASASEARAGLLRGAGVPFVTRPAAVDEDGLKTSLRAEGAPPVDAAQALAELKAQRISHETPEAFVIGADQLLDCEGEWFDKARDRDDAQRQLRALRGRSHTLATAVCVSRTGARVWAHVDSPQLTMRALSDETIERYLDAAGDEVVGCVGGYRLEGLGAQLFESVVGDYFAILGLPLLPLLEFLRQHGVVPS